MSITIRSGRNRGQDGTPRFVAGVIAILLFLGMGFYNVFTKGKGFDLGSGNPKLVGAGMIAFAVFLAVALPTLIVDFNG